MDPCPLATSPVEDVDALNVDSTIEFLATLKNEVPGGDNAQQHLRGVATALSIEEIPTTKETPIKEV